MGAHTLTLARVTVHAQIEFEVLGFVLIRPAERHDARAAFKVSTVQSQITKLIGGSALGIRLEGVFVGQRRIGTQGGRVGLFKYRS